MSLPGVRKPLSEDDMIEAMSTIMDGRAMDSEIEAFLVGLADRGETVEEITGAAKVLRKKASSLKAPYGAVDCCGTGGDGVGTYNISTAVAIVAAACGVPVAKHGNRAASSKSGAADVLEALGVNLDAPQEILEEALKTLGFAFLMAPNHHQAMKHVKAVRSKIKRRTVFNLLGPLANPAGTRHQLIGVYDEKWVEPLAQVLKNLSTKRAWVVHGADGLDEITVTDETHCAMLDEDGQIETRTLCPEDFGIERVCNDGILGGDAQENANALRALLEGRTCAYRQIVLANASAVLNIHGSAEGLEDGVARAAAAIDNGSAYQLLKDYIAISRGQF